MEIGRWGVPFTFLTLIPAFLSESPCMEVAETEYHTMQHDHLNGHVTYIHSHSDRSMGHSWAIPTMPAPTSINTTCTNVTFENGPLDMDISKRRGCSSCERILTITSSEIRFLPPYAFSEFHETTDLYITNVKMENISQGAFNVLHTIRGLHLSDNNLVTITDGVFNALRTLKVLDLSKNNISSISTQAFARIYLTLLDLSSNSLETFNNDILNQVTKIDNLDLSFNNINLFNFTYMSKINNLNLSNNYIRDIEGCFIELMALDLSKNEISSLDNLNCLNSTSKLSKLDLSYNHISSLNLDLFLTLDELGYLHLQHNNISSIPNECFSKLGSLYFLDLSSNNLVEFQYGLFDNMRRLLSLDISYNKFTTFKKHIYHSLRILAKLHIQHNKIYYLNTEDIIKFLPNLYMLDLDGNNFTCDMLIDIYHDLKLIVSKGKSFSKHNIHGIECSENSENSNGSIKFKISPYHEKNNFLDYIEKEGANSLTEYLTKIGNIDSNFGNSSSYKYLKALTSQIKFSENITNYFDRDFRNSSFVKYFDNLTKSADLLNTNFSQSAMYKYFNNDFIHSNFYKYLESLKTSGQLKYNESGNSNKPEELIGGFHKEINLDSNILVAITVLLIFIACLLVVFLFILCTKLTNRKDFKKNDSDEVELLGS